MILLIEDDPDISDLVRLRLSTAGYDVRTASTGATGVALAAELSPELVLVDIGLPDIDGFQVIRAIRADPKSAQTPMVIISVSDPDQHCVAGSGVDHLVKPIPRGRLEHVVAGLLSGPSAASVHTDDESGRRR